MNCYLCESVLVVMAKAVPFNSRMNVWVGSLCESVLTEVNSESREPMATIALLEQQ